MQLVESHPARVVHRQAGRQAAGLELDSGQPWVLEPFQAAFLRDVFRGHQECWLVIPEGNAKTTLIGGLVWHYQRSQRELDQCSHVQEALTRMYEQTVAHTTTDAKSTQAGFPTVISPAWFVTEWTLK